MDTFRVGSSGPARIILIGQRAKDEAVRTLKALETQGLSPHLRHPTPISGAMYEVALTQNTTCIKIWSIWIAKVP